MGFCFETIETSGGTVVGSTSTPVSYDNSSGGSPYKLTISTSSIPSLSAAGSYNIYFSGSSSGAPRYTTSGFPYTESTGTVSLTGGTMYFNNIQFVGGSACKRLPVIANVGGCSSLPVVFNDFEITEEPNNNILIQWSTSQEWNNNQFEVQRSENGITFETIGYVDGSGNSKGILDYHFLDTRVVERNLVYYRIKQIDIDGTFTYSVIKVPERKVVGSDIIIGPNPFESNAKIISSKGAFNVKVFNLQGSLVFEVEDQDNELIFGEDLESGIYFLHLKKGNDLIIRRIVKVK